MVTKLIAKAVKNWAGTCTEREGVLGYSGTGHLYTEGFDPYSEVVLYWEVFINSHVLQYCGSFSMIIT